MVKRVLFTIIGIVVVVGILGGIKTLQIRQMIAQGKEFVPPPEIVTSAEGQVQTWETLLSSVGSLSAVQGVTVTAEMTGKVTTIAFEPGTKVEAGALLIDQDTSAEQAQLRAAEASVELTKLSYERTRELVASKNVSQSDFDNAQANYKQALAQADNIRAMIAKKHIKAPFAGRLGIRQVNLGQVLHEGEPIVTLQSLDPIYVDFLLPQQQISLIEPGLTVRVTTDAFPDEVINGKINAISPIVDASTRNIKVQATMENPSEKLRPGMFVNVAVVLPATKQVMTIPATAVLYAPYSDSVFIIEPKEKDDTSSLVIRQQFVQIGERRGDFVAITSGLKPGQKVVSTGVFKLRNGQAVKIDNTLSPDFKIAPKPDNT